MDMRQFVRRHKIRATSELVDRNPNVEEDEWAHAATHWKVVLRRGNRQLTTYFSQGPAIGGEPEAEDVLGSLVADASGYCGYFDEWCEQYGYDSDSRRAGRIYRAVEEQTAKVKQFLGELYDEALTAEW